MIDAEDKELLLDEEKLKAEKKKAEQEYAEHERYLDDWREVLGKPAGRRIVWDLLGGMGYQKDLFNIDPLVMALNCGQYKLCIGLLKDIEEAMPGVTFRMQNEFRGYLANKEK